MQTHIGPVLAVLVSVSSYAPCLVDSEDLAILVSFRLSSSYTFSVSSSEGVMVWKKMTSPRSGSIRWCSTGGGSVSFLMVDFDVSYMLKPHPVWHIVSPSAVWDQDVELSASSPAPCLSACCFVSCHDNNELNFWNCKPVPIKCFSLIRLAVVMVSFHSIRNPD